MKPGAYRTKLQIKSHQIKQQSSSNLLWILSVGDLIMDCTGLSVHLMSLKVLLPTIFD